MATQDELARVYEDLAAALDRLPNAFPRTASGVELRLLKALVPPEDAWLATYLSGQMEPVDAIAARAGLPVDEALARLTAMAGRMIVFADELEGRHRFRLAPFIVGIYEGGRDRLNRETAELFEEYWTSGGGAGLMMLQPALHRVVPAHDSVPTEWVLPYEDVRAIFQANVSFHVGDCICRKERGLVGKACSAPVHNCVSFSPRPRPARPGDVSKEQALAILDEAEEVGLVHTVTNVVEGVGYVCNCCGCCCAILRGVTELGIEHAVARASYYAEIDADQCQGCGTCVGRCQVRAIAERDGVSVVDRARCIGCGLCVTGCPHDAAKLLRRPDAETVLPPLDFARWEEERVANRGLLA
jgi:ferredoxin